MMDPTPLPWLRYTSMEQFVLQKGKHYPRIKLPTGYVKLPHGGCFLNAKLLAKRCGLTYVEGFALPTHFRWPKIHGWNLDQSGRVIDSTWEDGGRDYYGVVIDPSIIRHDEELTSLQILAF